MSSGQQLTTDILGRFSQALGGRFARMAGFALSIALLMLIGRALWLERGQLAGIEIDRAFLIAAAVSLFAAVAGNLLGSIGSWLLLRRHAATFTLPYHIVLNGLSQLAKYMPGNVLHLVGRFYLVREHSNAKTALYFSVVEALLLCLSACSLGLLYLHFWQPDLWPLPSLMLLSALALAIGVFVLWRLALLKVSATTYWLVLLLYGLSYLGYGLAFSLLFTQVFDVPEAGIWLCAVMFALAFIVGYLTPGASGGLGVREFAFTVLAQPLVDPAAALAVIVLFRLFSIAGDLLFGMMALAVRRCCAVQLLRAPECTGDA